MTLQQWNRLLRVQAHREAQAIQQSSRCQLRLAAIEQQLAAAHQQLERSATERDLHLGSAYARAVEQALGPLALQQLDGERIQWQQQLQRDLARIDSLDSQRQQLATEAEAARLQVQAMLRQSAKRKRLGERIRALQTAAQIKADESLELEQLELIGSRG